MARVQLILAGSQTERLNQAHRLIQKALGSLPGEEGHPDLIILKPHPSLGIQDVRLLQKKLALKPYQASVKVALIIRADRLTVPAQNALLKTLEEPPTRTLIILLAAQKESLLPTILSRCQITQLIQKPQIEMDQTLTAQHLQTLISILRSGIGERLKQAEQFSQRQPALLLTQNFLFLWRQLLLNRTGVQTDRLPKALSQLTLSQIKKALENTEKVRLMLEANINPRLGIENLFLAYPLLEK